MKPSVLKVEELCGKLPNKNKDDIEARLFTIEQCASGFGIPTFVELGIFDGSSSFILMNALNRLECVSDYYAVDINMRYWDERARKDLGWYPKEEFAKKCRCLLRYYGIEFCCSYFIEGNSWEAAKRFQDNSVSWCLVDACHCYECCSKDLNAWAPKISSSGFLLIHDTGQQQKWSQWYHDKDNPRSFGVTNAVRDCSSLHSGFKLVYEVKTGHGMQVWRKQ